MSEPLSELLSAAEAIELLKTFACPCGYELKDDDLAFTKTDDGFLFECPGCGEGWKLSEAGRVC